MPIITSANLKGGSAKTSTCYHLAGILAQRGKKVLLIDNDPQASLTQGFWGPTTLRSLRREHTIFAVYDSEPPEEQVVHPTDFQNIWLLPGHHDATKWNMIGEEDWHKHERSILEFCEEVYHKFDYILIDCPPNLHLNTHAALIATDWAIVPLQAEDFGSQGLSSVIRAIAKVQKIRSGPPQILGYLLSMFDKRLVVHQTYSQFLRETHGTKVFITVVPHAKDFKEAVMLHKPVTYIKRRSIAHEAMEALADEIELRIRGFAA